MNHLASVAGGTPAALFDEIFERFSGTGQKHETGVERLAFGAQDAAARAQFRDFCGQLGLSFHVDAIGNQFGLIRPPSADETLVLVGSHLDSQPDGGRFDGQVGVAAGLAVVSDLSSRISPSCNLGVVNWANEEGARFQPSVMGSSVYVGALPLATALSSTDAHHVLLQDELAARGLGGASSLPGRLVAYAELHVEQGAVLETSGQDIGVVDRTWAAYKADVRISGVQTHTGPTPMRQRVDALAAAARLIVRVRKLGIEDPEQQLHTAVAWMRISPNSPNATPSLVEFKVELRSPDEGLLQVARQSLLACALETEQESGASCEFGEWSERRAAAFDPRAVDAAESAIAAIGLRTRRMPTIAGHDAVTLNAAGIPSALLFVPSVGGITHNAAELTHTTDLHNGVRALTATVEALLNRAETDSGD